MVKSSTRYAQRKPYLPDEEPAVFGHGHFVSPAHGYLCDNSFRAGQGHACGGGYVTAPVVHMTQTGGLGVQTSLTGQNFYTRNYTCKGNIHIQP